MLEWRLEIALRRVQGSGLGFTIQDLGLIRWIEFVSMMFDTGWEKVAHSHIWTNTNGLTMAHLLVDAQLHKNGSYLPRSSMDHTCHTIPDPLLCNCASINKCAIVGCMDHTCHASKCSAAAAADNTGC